jgi:hypothetical protein
VSVQGPRAAGVGATRRMPRPEGLAEVSGARLRAEQVLTRLLSLIVFGNFITQPLSIAAEWAGSRYSVEGLGAPVIGLSYGAWLLRKARRCPRSFGNASWRRGWSPDLAFIVLIAGAGLALEAVVFTPSVAASMNNAGFTALGACAYAAAARLSWRVSLPILLVVMVGHAVALKATPTEGLQGALQLASIWAATRLVVAEVRRAGRAAEDACELARRAEREEASARVHDALGLLRVAARGDGAGADLARAAAETTRRTDAWLNGSSVPAGLAEAIELVVGQFPDLDIELNIDAILVMADPTVVTMVARAVHTLLGNVREHAGAARVEIIATGTPGGWTLTIRDDGRGFDVSSTNPRAGLTRYTHDALGAVGVAMSLQSAPGLGTTVTLRAPHILKPPDARPTGQARGAPRFAAWRSRPQGGVSRAAWISDVSQAGLVASYAVMVMSGYGHLLRHSERPAAGGILVIAGTTLMIVTWLRGPRPPTMLAVTATVFAVCAGGITTALNGQDAATGDKLGIMLMAWSCMLLAAARPDCRWLAVGLALVPLTVLGRVDIVSGVVSALFVVLASLVAAWLVSSLTEFGTQADVDRRRAGAVERRSAAPLLFRQASVISDAATSSASNRFADRLSVIARQAEDYLQPPRRCLLSVGLHARLGVLPDMGDRLDMDTTHLDCALDPTTARQVVDAVTEIASRLLHGDLAGRVSVRGVGAATQWQLTLLAEFDDGQQAEELAPVVWQRLRAELAATGIELSSQAMPGGDRYVTLRPAGRKPNRKLP